MNNFFRNVPPTVRALILLNAVIFFFTWLLEAAGNTFMMRYFALYYPASPLFNAGQLLTSMFMHGGIWHLLFNMYALWMFGCPLEYQWGGKKFLLFYLVTGIGAGLFYLSVQWLQLLHIESTMLPEMLLGMQEMIGRPGFTEELLALHAQGQTYVFPGAAGDWFNLLTTPTVGASGALFGVLAAFGVLYPNVRLQFIFPPIGFKAKWVVLVVGGLSFLLDFDGNVAHFAHLGGALVGFLFVKYWQKKKRLYNYYSS